MTRTPPMVSVTPELLARHDGWLRALIRGLVDGDEADDVLQEVWGSVARRPPRDRQALPAFLATVARRVAGRHRRAVRRRARREQLVAAARTGEGLAAMDTSEVVARAEERQRVAQAVLDLDEPFRSALLLRYFEDCTPVDIARRLGVPAATVRTRLHRAHEQLRQRFARERGAEWRGQLAALGIALGSRERGAVASGPSATIGARLTWALVAAAMVMAVGVWWFADALLRPRARPVAEGTARIAAASDDPRRAGMVAPDVERKPAPAPPAERPDAALASSRIVAGVLLDPRGNPLGRVPVRWRPDRSSSASPTEPSRELGLSNGDGTFRAEAPMGEGDLVVGDGYVTLRFWPLAGRGAVDDALVIACPSIRVAGRVVDAEGQPAAGRRVAVAFHDVYGFPQPTAGSELAHPQIGTKTDAEGRFELEGVPAFAAGDLCVDVFRAVVPLPERDTEGWVITLGQGRPVRGRSPQPRPPEPRRLELAVRIVDGEGVAVERPIVYVDGVGTISGHDVLGGNAPVLAEHAHAFLSHDSDPHTVWIAAPGFGAEERAVWFDDAGKASLEVRLGPPRLQLSGRVLDVRGRPLVDALVMVEDPTLVDPGLLRPRFVEAPRGQENGPSATTARDGSFSITGVLQRSYRLRVIEAATGYAETFGPFEPGPQVAIQVPARRVRPSFEVVVRGTDGAPVAGAEVSVHVLQRRLEDQVNGWTLTASLRDRAAGQTDDRGVVSFAEAPGGDLEVEVAARGFLDQTGRCTRGDAEPFEVVLRREVVFRVDAAVPANRVLSLRLFDAEGRELEVLRASRNGRLPSGFSFGVHRGRSVVAAVDESVRRAELAEFHSGEVVRSMQVVPRATGVTVLDFPE